eukprot:scaffold14928_cov447-Ochromonas_danica.AAC.1
MVHPEGKYASDLTFHDGNASQAFSGTANDDNNPFLIPPEHLVISGPPIFPSSPSEYDLDSQMRSRYGSMLTGSWHDEDGTQSIAHTVITGLPLPALGPNVPLESLSKDHHRHHRRRHGYNRRSVNHAPGATIITSNLGQDSIHSQYNDQFHPSYDRDELEGFNQVFSWRRPQSAVQSNQMDQPWTTLKLETIPLDFNHEILEEQSVDDHRSYVSADTAELHESSQEGQSRWSRLERNDTGDISVLEGVADQILEERRSLVLDQQNNAFDSKHY